MTLHTILQNEHFWIYFALLIFFILFGKKILVGLKDFLTSSINEIKSDITDSEVLFTNSKNDLEQIKAQYKKLQTQINNKKKQSLEIGHNISETFFENLTLKEKYQKNSFSISMQAEVDNNLKLLQRLLIQSNTAIVHSLLVNNIDNKYKNKLLDKEIENLPEILNNLK